MRYTLTFIFLIVSIILVSGSIIDNCAAKYNGLILPNGKSFCKGGSFLTGVLNGMNALKASSRLSSERVPEHTPELLLNWVNGMSSNEAISAFRIMSGTEKDTHGELVEMLSPFLHYNGKSCVRKACEKMDSDSFVIIESSVGTGLLQECSGDVSASMNLVDGSVVPVPKGSVAHHVLVSYSEYEQKRNSLRSRGLPVPEDSVFPATAIIPHLGYRPVVPYNATRFTQCDSKWGKAEMFNGPTAETVCQVGCLMTSIATSINNHQIHFKDSTTNEVVQSNPGTFNNYLRNNEGYTSSNQLIHTAVAGICKRATTACNISLPDDFKQTTLSYSQLKNRINNKQTVVANVSNGRHFVLAIGYDTVDKDVVYVSDSRTVFNPSYKMNEIVGWRIYNIAGPK